VNIFGQFLPSLIPGFLSGLTLLWLAPFLVLESGIRKSASTNADIAQKLSAESRAREALLGTVDDQVELLAAYAHFPAVTRNDLLKTLSAALFLGLGALYVFKAPTGTQEQFQTAWGTMAMLSGVPAGLLFWMGLDRAARAKHRTSLLAKRSILKRPLVQAWLSQAPAVQMSGALFSGCVAALFGYFVSGAAVIEMQDLGPNDDWSMRASLAVVGGLFVAGSIVTSWLFVSFSVPHKMSFPALDSDRPADIPHAARTRRHLKKAAILVIAVAIFVGVRNRD
jgi:hypothetical protein